MAYSFTREKSKKEKQKNQNKFEKQLDLLSLPFFQRLNFSFKVQTVQSIVVWTNPKVAL